MKITPAICPECGESVLGTVDEIPGVACVVANDDGSFDYSGETTVFWDGQRTVLRDDKPVVQCENGHEWPADIEN